MSEDRITKADAIASSLQPLAPAELARVASEKDQPRAALSVAANLAGGESLLWIGRPSERVIRGYWTFAAACMIGLTPLLYLAIEGSRGPLAIAGILLAMVTLPIWAAWKQALVRHTTYELTTERLRVTHGILSLEVDDVADALERVRAAGIPVEYGPADEPWGVRRFYVRDPFGKLVNVLAHR